MTPIEAARAENFALAALIGVYNIRAFPYSLKVWKVFLLTIFLFIQPARAEILHTLSKNIFSSFQPARAEILHTLSKNIFSSFQPARAELLHTLSKIILFLLYNQPGQSFYTPYQRIFFLLPISQGIAFTHPLKEYFYNLNWNVKRTNDQAFRLSSRNDLAVEIRSQISDSHIPGQLLSNGQMSLTNQYKYKLKSKKKFKNIINNILYCWCNKNIVMLCSLTFLSRSIKKVPGSGGKV